MKWRNDKTKLTDKIAWTGQCIGSGKDEGVGKVCRSGIIREEQRS